MDIDKARCASAKCTLYDLPIWSVYTSTRLAYANLYLLYYACSSSRGLELDCRKDLC